MIILNETLNEKLEMMETEYGVEFNDYGFTGNESNVEIAIIIARKKTEITSMVIEENEEAFETVTVEMIEMIETIKAIENGAKLNETQSKFFKNKIWTVDESPTDKQGYVFKTYYNLDSYAVKSRKYLSRAYNTGRKSIFIDALKTVIALNQN